VRRGRPLPALVRRRRGRARRSPLDAQRRPPEVREEAVVVPAPPRCPGSAAPCSSPGPCSPSAPAR
jgi:hypothetical protein